MPAPYKAINYKRKKGKKQAHILLLVFVFFSLHFNADRILSKHTKATESEMTILADRAKAIAKANNAPEILPYQLEGIEYLSSVRSGMLGDDPGLGKTAQAVLAAAVNGYSVVVIVCPCAVSAQWKAECLRWAGKTATVIDHPTSALPEGGWLICPYSRLKAIENILEIEVLILDECHYLKDATAKRTKLLWGYGPRYGLRHRAYRVWMMSGTPIPNRLREIAHICVGLRHEVFPRIMVFLRRYCWSETHFFGKKHVEKYDGATNVGELRALLQESRLILRRRKEDVLSELPAKRRAAVPLSLSREEVACIEAKIAVLLSPEDQAAVVAALQAGASLPALEQFSRARAYLGEAKAMAAAEWLAEEARAEKIAVFCWHRGAGVKLLACLAELGISGSFADGKLSPEERQATIAAFQEDAKPRVWIGTIGACGTGLNGLQTACSRVVFLEASWVPSQNVQAEDRLHRIGQKGSVLAQYLYTPVALDKHLIKIVTEKAAMISLVLD